MQETQQRADRRRLACPIEPEKPKYLVLLHHEIHVPDAQVLAVSFGEPLGLYRRTHPYSFKAINL
jgi:hypothetical protein